MFITKCSHSASIFVIHLNLSLRKSLLKATCRCGSEVKRRSSFISPRSDQRPATRGQGPVSSEPCLLQQHWQLHGTYKTSGNGRKNSRQATNFLF